MLLLTEGTLKSLLSDEDFARTNKIGMWSMEFDYPWDWRKKN
jgi:endonuclease YncB( thermonuclease family)